MAETTNLYLLIFPERGVIKIGKADDVHNRIQTLRRWWGNADYEASYYLSATLDVIFKLEKSLHFLLSEYAVRYEEGDGRTELFSVDAIDIALQHIELYTSSSPDIAGLKKGVPRPVLVSHPARRRGKHITLTKKSKAMVDGVMQNAVKFGRINRLLIILLRRQSRIPFQYDVIDNTVYFRVRLLRFDRVADYFGKLSSYFSFRIDDFSGLIGVNCCTVIRDADVVQFKVSLLSKDDGWTRSELFVYLSSQSEWLLKKLPQRSSAATSPIPMIDEAQFFNNMLQNYEETA